MNTPDGGSGDGGTGSSGLTVSWAVQPAIPGDIKDGVTVEEMGFKLQSLHITGDAASVSTPAEIDLMWDANGSPAVISFPNAPTGLYSKVSLRMDGELLDNSYWINGHAMVNGTSYPFKIYDRDYLDIYLYQDESLAPGGSITVPVLVEVDHALQAIDWSKLDMDEGTLLLDTGDAYMPTFRANLVESFVVKSSSSN